MGMRRFLFIPGLLQCISLGTLFERDLSPALTTPGAVIPAPVHPGHYCGRVGRNASPRHRGSQHLRANKRKARRAARVRGRG